MKILVTGFDPFGGEAINPAWEAVSRLPKEIEGAEIVTGRFGITPERVAINVDDARIADNKGQQPLDTVIQADGAPAYFTTLPVKAMVEAVKKAGLPASLSNTAGTFVCNHIMYQNLYYLTKHYPKTQGGFIHVPYVTEQVVDKPGQASMALADIVKGLTVCLETIVAYQGKTDAQVVGGETH